VKTVALFLASLILAPLALALVVAAAVLSAPALILAVVLPEHWEDEVVQNTPLWHLYAWSERLARRRAA
jgi:hypothetical protein